MKDRKLKIASFGYRSIPPKNGAAGADTCAVELYSRLAQRGHDVLVYNRLYSSDDERIKEYKGIKIQNLRTINKAGFDTLLHSFLCTLHILFHNNADIIHIANGGNSIWGLFLRLFGKKVIVSQDGVDWRRAKWPWYAKLFLYFSSQFTVKISDKVVFDNIYSRQLFEKKCSSKNHGKFSFIPWGGIVSDFQDDQSILGKLGLKPKEYFLFVGRFIPDKGIHYLISAFEKIKTNKKLVIVGGSPNPSEYEKKIKGTKDSRIVFPGYFYGNDSLNLIKNSYLYIQPSDIEGLSPVILTVMTLGTPLLCSDIKENLFIVNNCALLFRKGDVESLRQQLAFALLNPAILENNAVSCRSKIAERFDWEKITDQYIDVFSS